MARIAGVDLPRDKRVEAALPYIFGIGLHTSQVLLQRTGSKAPAVPSGILKTSSRGAAPPRSSSG